MLVTALALSLVPASPGAFALPAAPPPPAAAPRDERAPDGSLLIVLNKSENTASLLDPNTGETVATLPTGPGPHEAATSPDQRLAVVADYGHQEPGNTLTVLDLVEREVARTIDLGEYARPHGILFRGPDELVVTAESRQALITVDLESGAVRAVPTDQVASHMVALAPDGARAYVANIGSGSISVVDLESGERVANVPTGAGAEGIDVHPDGTEVWVTNRSADTVSVVDTDSLEVVATLPCASFPIRVKFTPDGAHALVSNAKSDEVVVFDAAERAELRRVPMELEAAGDDEARLFDASFSEGSLPIGILVQPDGRYAYVANANADAILVLDLRTWRPAGALRAGREPDGMAWAVPPSR